MPKALASCSAAIGNAALDGASMLLLDTTLREHAASIAKTAKTVDLSTSTVFTEEYVAGMLFPKTESE